MNKKLLISLLSCFSLLNNNLESFGEDNKSIIVNFDSTKAIFLKTFGQNPQVPSRLIPCREVESREVGNIRYCDLDFLLSLLNKKVLLEKISNRFVSNYIYALNQKDFKSSIQSLSELGDLSINFSESGDIVSKEKGFKIDGKIVIWAILYNEYQYKIQATKSEDVGNPFAKFENEEILFRIEQLFQYIASKYIESISDKNSMTDIKTEITNFKTEMANIPDGERILSFVKDIFIEEEKLKNTWAFSYNKKLESEKEKEKKLQIEQKKKENEIKIAKDKQDNKIINLAYSKTKIPKNILKINYTPNRLFAHLASVLKGKISYEGVNTSNSFILHQVYIDEFTKQKIKYDYLFSITQISTRQNTFNYVYLKRVLLNGIELNSYEVKNYDNSFSSFIYSNYP